MTIWALALIDIKVVFPKEPKHFRYIILQNKKSHITLHFFLNLEF